MSDLRKLRVDMDAILEAMADLPPEIQGSLNLETGEVVLQGDDDEEEADDEVRPAKVEEIARIDGSEMYGLMERFAESIDEEDIREKFSIALGGKGSFARFRDVVGRYPDLEERWFRERQTYLVKEAVDWLTSIGIEPVYELRPRAPRVSPQPSKAPEPKVRLAHVLALGAPDGKTEILEGRVYRQIIAGNEAQARALFKSLSREASEHHGIAWRNQLIEGRVDFTAGGLTIRLRGATVEVWLDAPPPILRAFGFPVG